MLVVAGISDAIAASLATASEFTRSLFDDESWTAQQVIEFVNKQRNATVSDSQLQWPTARRHGHRGQRRGFDLLHRSPKSVLARNLAVNDRIALSVWTAITRSWDRAKPCRWGRRTRWTLIAELANVSQAGKFTPEGWDGYIYRVDFRRLLRQLNLTNAAERATAAESEVERRNLGVLDAQPPAPSGIGGGRCF